MHQPSRQRHNFFPSRFASNLMLPAYLLGMLMINGLQLKNSSKVHLNKQITRNLLRKNDYKKLRRPGVTCFYSVNLGRLVMSFTLVVMTCKHA